jgi:hypothetical protein
MSGGIPHRPLIRVNSRTNLFTLDALQERVRHAGVLPAWRLWTIGASLKAIIQDAYSLRRPTEARWYDVRQLLLLITVKIFPWNLPASVLSVFTLISAALTTQHTVYVQQPFLFFWTTTKSIVVPQAPSALLVGALVVAFYGTAYALLAKLIKHYMIWDCRRILNNISASGPRDPRSPRPRPGRSL